MIACTPYLFSPNNCFGQALMYFLSLYIKCADSWFYTNTNEVFLFILLLGLFHSIWVSFIWPIHVVLSVAGFLLWMGSIFCVDISQLIYTLSCWWTFGLFPVWATMNITVINIYIPDSVTICFHTLKVELLNHVVSVCSILRKHQNDCPKVTATFASYLERMQDTKPKYKNKFYFNMITMNNSN